MLLILADLLGEVLAVLFEGVLEFAADVIGDLIGRCFKHTVKPPEKRNPILAGIGYVLLGLIAGGLSLLIFPNSFARSEKFHGISLLVSPVLAGLGMAGLGWILKRQGKRVMRLDSFIFGFIMALPIAIVRFFYTS